MRDVLRSRNEAPNSRGPPHRQGCLSMQLSLGNVIEDCRTTAPTCFKNVWPGSNDLGNNRPHCPSTDWPSPETELGKSQPLQRWAMKQWSIQEESSSWERSLFLAQVADCTADFSVGSLPSGNGLDDRASMTSNFPKGGVMLTITSNKHSPGQIHPQTTWRRDVATHV